MWAKKLRHDDEGVAMVFALSILIVMGGLAVLFTARSLTQSRATGGERDFEAALHTSEAGVDVVLAKLNDNGAYVTPDTSGNAYVLALKPDLDDDATADLDFDADNDGHIDAGLDPDDEKAWAIAAATGELAGADACVVMVTAEGEACGIRPREPATSDFDDDGKLGEPLPWMYSVGWIPSRAAPEKTRVLKIQFDKGFFSPDKAIKTNGDLHIGGSVNVAGGNGAVHANGNLSVSGNPTTSGAVTTSGTCSGNSANFASPCAGDQPDDRVGPVYALAVYEGVDDIRPAREAVESYRTAGSPAPSNYGQPGENKERWYDLCPDGTVRVPAFTDSAGNNPGSLSGDPVNGRAAPCRGDILYNSAAPLAPSNYRGWSYRGSTNPAVADVAREWSFGGNSRPVCEGAYFVHHADVEISGGLTACSGSTVRVTIMIDAHGVIDPSTDPKTDTTCSTAWTGAESGSLRMTGIGSGTIAPFLLDLLYLADRDIRLAGNQSTQINGAVLAHEQVDINGNPNIAGALAAQDACDRPDSPVHANVVSGNFTLLHNGDLNLPLPSIVRITYWSEF